MTIHYAKRPKTGNLSLQVSYYAVTILVNFTHLWNEAGSRVHSNFFDYIITVSRASKTGDLLARVFDTHVNPTILPN